MPFYVNFLNLFEFQMFILTFKKSTSKKYPAALKAAENIGCVVLDDQVVIELTDPELLYAYESLKDLLRIIQHWKSVDAKYRGKKINPFRFIFIIYTNIRECAEQKNCSVDPKHCWRDNDNEGWGCRFLHPFRKEISGSGEYKKSNQYWYNFGIRDGGTWKVDKRLIAEKLHQYIEAGHLHLCPFLNLDRVQDIIVELPETIQIDRVNFRPFKTDGKDVNIRHTPQHFAFIDKLILAKSSTYNDLCMINYLAQLEHDMRYFEYSKN